MEGRHTDIPIMLRVHNTNRYLQETLDMIGNQTLSSLIYAFACEPTQETRGVLKPYVEHIFTLSEENYRSWSFINRAMELTDEEFIVFLDADSTPVDVHWLAWLTGICRREGAVSAFSRKLPRADAGPLVHRDLTRVYTEEHGLISHNGRHFFALDGSVFRKSAWINRNFSDQLGAWAAFSWTWQARREGCSVVYAKQARILTSPQYLLRHQYRELRNMGAAEALTFSWEPGEIKWRTYAFKPAVRHIREDWAETLHQGRISPLVYAPILRIVQMIGKYTGFIRAYRRRT